MECLGRIYPASTDHPSLKTKENLVQRGVHNPRRQATLSPVTGRLYSSNTLPVYSSQHLLLSQMDSTTYTYSTESVQAEQPVDMDQSSNGSFYCVIA
ncbi:hypothetical protein BDV93DRAFT_556803 [Ceratobasidium sp. AG-I]|nr:hypothetical protein BDV93DRAFT_556803 [Ceratobasidium sp. AG-I]